MREVPESEVPYAIRRGAALDPKLILLVEDNPDDEFLCLDALSTGGLNSSIAVARDGAEALDFLLGLPIGKMEQWTLFPI